MVKINRTPIPPASLAIEKEKVNGSYTNLDVINQLKHDFNNKCYLCELKDLTDVEVEHLLPHYNRKIKERVFDWDNLFYCCPHCNKVKNNRKYDEKILDCCKIDPEKFINHIYKDGKVTITVNDISNDDDIIKSTADLLQNCFESKNTGIRTIQCYQRVKRFEETLNTLYKTLENFKNNKNSMPYLRALRAMLSREYKFAAFTRYYVRSHINEYPELKKFVL